MAGAGRLVNSEVDALITGGLSPMRFLVVPRVLAGVLVAPNPVC